MKRNPRNGKTELIEAVIGEIYNHIGKKNAISNTELISACGLEIAEATIRKIIHHIRLNYIPFLCASEKGYYIAETTGELQNYLVSLNRRINNQKRILVESSKYHKQWVDCL